jgi:hypothetical protein
LDLIAANLPMLSVTVAPPAVLLPASWLLRPRGPLVAAHRLGTWHSVPVATVLERLDWERHTGEIPTFSLVPNPERWLAEDWQQRIEVTA